MSGDVLGTVTLSYIPVKLWLSYHNLKQLENGVGWAGPVLTVINMTVKC